MLPLRKGPKNRPNERALPEDGQVISAKNCQNFGMISSSGPCHTAGFLEAVKDKHVLEDWPHDQWPPPVGWRIVAIGMLVAHQEMIARGLAIPVVSVCHPLKLCRRGWPARIRVAAGGSLRTVALW